jgi:hypothetical protein
LFFKKATFNARALLRDAFMQWLSTLSRVAFICNLLFLVAVLNRFFSFLHDPDVIGTVVVLGYGVFFLNLLLVLVYAVLAFRKKLRPAIPPWLAVGNSFFLLIQLIYFT